MPTPGSASSSAKLAGTCPPCLATSCVDRPDRYFALDGARPICLTCDCSTSSGSAAMASGVGAAAKSAGVISFTFLSVDCTVPRCARVSRIATAASKPYDGTTQARSASAQARLRREHHGAEQFERVAVVQRRVERRRVERGELRSNARRLGAQRVVRRRDRRGSLGGGHCAPERQPRRSGAARQQRQQQRRAAAQHALAAPAVAACEGGARERQASGALLWLTTRCGGGEASGHVTWHATGSRLDARPVSPLAPPAQTDSGLAWANTMFVVLYNLKSQLLVVVVFWFVQGGRRRLTPRRSRPPS